MMNCRNEAIEKRKAVRLAAVLACILLGSGCAPLSGYRDFVDADFQPPLLLGAETLDARHFQLYFSEPVILRADSVLFRVSDSDTPKHLTPVGGTGERESPVSFSTDYQPDPGEELTIFGHVADRAGNSLSFSAAAYGWNEAVPELVINEFTTQGSANHPDRVELLILSAGSLAGVTFFVGVNSDWDARVSFPDVTVEAGDYVVIHCGREADTYPAETVSKDESSSPFAVDSAWDIWIEDGSGLSGNNGIISIYASPQGKLLDAVLYSNRTSASDALYAGFGSRALKERAAVLAEQGGWFPASYSAPGADSVGYRADEEPLKPEDGVNPDDSTATRSMNRSAGAPDTGTKSDWHIVPTSKFSFGGENFEGVYEQ
jgi:hypothetical protein